MTRESELPRDVLDFLCAAAARRVPEEACGVLLGRTGPAPSRRVPVTRALEGRNAAPDPERGFELHPGDLVAAEDAARLRGESVVGIWHSHPSGPARFSERDLRGAWPGWCHAVVDAVRGEVWIRGPGEGLDETGDRSGRGEGDRGLAEGWGA